MAEEALKLALRRRISLLHLGARRCQRSLRVYLRRAGRAAAAVASRAAADQDDDVARLRRLAHDVRLRHSADDGADLHALRHVAFMVELMHLARRKTDLVAVGAEACRRPLRNLLLRQLARQCIGDLAAWVGGASHTHRLIDVGTPRQGITDRTAKARRRTAKRFNFRRMVVRLILEHHEPIFFLAVNLHRHDDAARVDLIGSIEIFQKPLLTQRLHADARKIHQGDIRLLSRMNLLAVEHVELHCLRKHRCVFAVAEVHLVDDRRKRRMAAVIRPIRVDDAKLRDRRLTLLRRGKILLAELQILQTHGKAALFQQISERRHIHAAESRKRLHIGRLFDLLRERRRLLQSGLAAFDLVDAVRLNLCQKICRNRADEHINDRRANCRTLLLRHKLHALRRRISTLVVLPRQILDSERLRLGKVGQFLLVDRIDGRLNEDDVAHRLVFFV